MNRRALCLSIGTASMVAALICGLLLREKPLGFDSRLVSYWLWAGLTEKDIPKDFNGTLYIYQGIIEDKAGYATLDHKGIFPYPIKQGNIGLVFRLAKLANPREIADVYISSANDWARHGVKIQSLQIDYDCPTSKLKEYAVFLSKLREALPRQHALSVTGLGDWIVSGDREDVEKLATVADDITFQLYRGRRYLPNAADYIIELGHARFPFRVGLLAGVKKQDWIDRLNSNSYYRGVTYFLQRQAP